MEIKVIIPDEKKNDLTLKRMDSFEKKLDQQYKSFIDNRDKSINKNFDALTKSLSKSLGGFEKALKSFKPSSNDNINKVLDSFERKLDQQYKALIENKKNAKSPENDTLTKSLLKSIEGLENAIKNIRFPNSRRPNMGGQFEKMTSRLEEAIRKARPRMIPSPS